MTTSNMARRFVSAAAVAALSLPAVLHAQAASGDTVRIDARWRSFLGCWGTIVSRTNGPIVCLAPTAKGSEVEMVTIARDSVLERVFIDASGAKVPRTRDGCTGWETGNWSADERRLFTKSEYTCPDGAKQAGEGLISMTDENSFSRVEGVKAKRGTGVRIITFVSIQDTINVPTDIERRLRVTNPMRALAARVDAAAAISLADVTEASQLLEAPVVEAWLADRGQRFTLTVNDLRAMKDSKVPDRVIDMVVAVSNPDAFLLAAGNNPTAKGRPNTVGPDYTALLDRSYYARRGSIYGYRGFYDPFDPFGYSGFGYGSYLNGFFPYGSYYSGYGYGGSYGNGYGYGWLPSNGPIVIIPNGPTEVRERSRVINGQGYVGGGSDGGGTARPRPDIGSNSGSGVSSSVGNSSAGSSSSGGGGGASASGGGEARTAKPRP